MDGQTDTEGYVIIPCHHHVAGLKMETPSGLGDSMTDRWTDIRHTEGQTHGKIVLLPHTLTIRGSDVASLVEFRPVV